MSARGSGRSPHWGQRVRGLLLPAMLRLRGVDHRRSLLRRPLRVWGSWMRGRTWRHSCQGLPCRLWRLSNRSLSNRSLSNRNLRWRTRHGRQGTWHGLPWRRSQRRRPRSRCWKLLGPTGTDRLLRNGCRRGLLQHGRCGRPLRRSRLRRSMHHGRTSRVHSRQGRGPGALHLPRMGSTRGRHGAQLRRRCGLNSSTDLRACRGVRPGRGMHRTNGMRSGLRMRGTRRSCGSRMRPGLGMRGSRRMSSWRGLHRHPGKRPRGRTWRRLSSRDDRRTDGSALRLRDPRSGRRPLRRRRLGFPPHPRKIQHERIRHFQRRSSPYRSRRCARVRRSRPGRRRQRGARRPTRRGRSRRALGRLGCPRWPSLHRRWRRSRGLRSRHRRSRRLRSPISHRRHEARIGQRVIIHAQVLARLEPAYGIARLLFRRCGGDDHVVQRRHRQGVVVRVGLRIVTQELTGREPEHARLLGRRRRRRWSRRPGRLSHDSPSREPYTATRLGIAIQLDVALRPDDAVALLQVQVEPQLRHDTRDDAQPRGERQLIHGRHVRGAGHRHLQPAPILREREHIVLLSHGRGDHAERGHGDGLELGDRRLRVARLLGEHDPQRLEVQVIQLDEVRPQPAAIDHLGLEGVFELSGVDEALADQESTELFRHEEADSRRLP